MILGLEFIIYGGFLVICLLPLYIYRKKIFYRAFDSTTHFNIFLDDVKLYIRSYHPKIKIDYSIVEKTKNEPNIVLRETLVVENIIEQFINHEYKKETQKSIPKEKLWTGYEDKSRSNPKFPMDWQDRKELAFRRESRTCNRCGTNLATINEAYSSFVKEINDGGGYNFENIIILCSDCNKILNSKNNKNLPDSLALTDKLMTFVRD